MHTPRPRPQKFWLFQAKVRPWNTLVYRHPQARVRGHPANFIPKKAGPELCFGCPESELAGL